MKKSTNIKLSKTSVLIMLSIVLGIVGVFMNFFTHLRWQSFPYATFGNVFISWMPMLVMDIMIEVFGKKKGIVIPAFVFLIQGILFLLAILIVQWEPSFILFRTTEGGEKIFAIIFSDSFRIWFGGVVANYSGLLVNGFIMYFMKKNSRDDSTWYSFLFRAIMSSVAGQFVDNVVFTLVGLGFDGDWIAFWKSIGFKQLVEVGMEVIFFPITLLLVKKIDKLPDYITSVDAVIVYEV